MNHRPAIRILCIAALASLTACTATVPVGTSLRDGIAVQAPTGWVDFCRRNAADPSCEARPLDRQSWNQLLDAQARVRAIDYVPDSRNFAKTEYWQVAGTSGDCEDMTLAARQRLLDLGWPASVLRMASVFTETREKHSVLTIEVTHSGRRETLVIDNRNPGIATWDELKQKGYWFLARQAAHGSAWVKIEGGQGKGWNAT
jgi:predicted transglutaminase-like cysteine proteinase